MFRNELRKCLYGILFLFVLLAIFYFLMLVMKRDTIDGKTRQYYTEYMEILKGTFNDQKEAFIMDEYARVKDALEVNLEWQNAGEQIDPEVIGYAMDHETAYDMIYDKYLHILQIENEAEQVFYDDIDWKDFLKKSSLNYFEMFFLIIFVMYAVTIDFYEGRAVLIKTSYKGNLHYIAVKQNVCIFAAIIVAISFFLIEGIYIALFLNVSTLSLPVRCISGFEQLRWSMTIGEYILFRELHQILWCITIVLVMCMVALIVKKIQTGIFIGVFFVLLPVALKNIISRNWGMLLFGIHLDRDFSACSYGGIAMLLAVILAIIMYGVNMILWSELEYNMNAV